MSSSRMMIKAIDRIMGDGKWRSVQQIMRALAKVDPAASLHHIQRWHEARNTPLDQGLRRKTDGKGHVYWRVLPPESRFQSSVLQFTEAELLARDQERIKREQEERERKERTQYRVPEEVDENVF